jgi:transcriptional regulator with XRE-family HTH domain
MPNPYAPDRLAALVRRAAKLDGISIAELSRRSGVGRVTLQRWLTGVRGIRIGDAIRVLDALGAVVTVGRSQPERFPKSGGARAKKSAEGQ